MYPFLGLTPPLISSSLAACRSDLSNLARGSAGGTSTSTTSNPLIQKRQKNEHQHHPLTSPCHWSASRTQGLPPCPCKYGLYLGVPSISQHFHATFGFLLITRVKNTIF